MGIVLTFAQQKGGAGKTTLLATLAHSLLLADCSVAVTDLDPQGTLSHWLSLGDVAGLHQIETASYRIGSDLRDGKDNFDFVLVDCPGSANTLLESAIRESDMVVIPCQTSPVDVWATGAILDMCRSEKTPAKVVLNRVAPRGRAVETTRAALAKMGAEVMNSEIGNRVAYANGIAIGTSALGLTGQQKAVAEVAQLTKEVLETLRA